MHLLPPPLRKVFSCPPPMWARMVHQCMRKSMFWTEKYSQMSAIDVARIILAPRYHHWTISFPLQIILLQREEGRNLACLCCSSLARIPRLRLHLAKDGSWLSYTWKTQALTYYLGPSVSQWRFISEESATSTATFQWFANVTPAFWTAALD